MEIDRGVPAKRVDIVYRDLTKPDSYFDVLIWGVESRFSADYVKGAWYVKTDYKSPNGRILKADPGIMPDAWTTVVPEGADAIDGFNIVGDKIYVKRLHDVKTETGRLHAGRQTGGHDRLRRHRFRDHARRAARRTATASSASSRSSCRPRSTASIR